MYPPSPGSPGLRRNMMYYVTILAVLHYTLYDIIYVLYYTLYDIMYLCVPVLDACLESHRCTNTFFCLTLPPPFMPPPFGSSRLDMCARPKDSGPEQPGGTLAELEQAKLKVPRGGGGGERGGDSASFVFPAKLT